MCGNCVEVVKAIEAYIAKEDNDLENALKKAGFIHPKGAVKSASQLEDALADALEDEVNYYQKKAAKEKKLPAVYNKWGAIFAGDSADAILSALFAKHFEREIPKLATAYIKLIDPALTVSTITARTTAWARSWSGELAKKMRLTTKENIEKLLTSTLEEGKSVADFTQAIMDDEIRLTRTRARQVALTETLRAHSVAQQEAIIQNPSVDRKEWVHTGAYRNAPRENHVAISGQIVGKNEPFELIGADGEVYRPLYPRDTSLPAGESINCHCIHRGVVNDDVFGLSVEERREMQEKAIIEDNIAYLGEWLQTATATGENQ